MQKICSPNCTIDIVLITDNIVKVLSPGQILQIIFKLLLYLFAHISTAFMQSCPRVPGWSIEARELDTSVQSANSCPHESAQ